MPSYVVVGASRGIGYAFLQHLSKDPNNLVTGTVRTPQPTLGKVKSDNLKNVHILTADLLDRSSLQSAAVETSKLTGGKVDYLILNGAYYNLALSSKFFDDFEANPETLENDLEIGWKTNVVGIIHAINAFLPLIKAGKTKKVMALSTGLADDALTREYEVWEHAGYSANKAALNMVVAKYAARYGKEGVLFLAISPGVVETGHEMPEGSEMPLKFVKYAPHFAGPITPAESVEKCMSVLERASVERGDGGTILSHLGNKQWI